MAAAPDAGVIGLGVMGRALAANLVDHGVGVVGFDRSAERMAAAQAGTPRVECAGSLNDLVRRLEPPRVLLLMVPAGPPVDRLLEQLTGLLSAGDTLVDAGNSHFRDTARRGPTAAEGGIRYLGIGVSGGRAGARHGPCLMIGGTLEAWQGIEPLLRPVAAQLPSGACVARVGPDGAGHFVKMVHNGIEYADMQLIGESYSLLRRAGAWEHEAIAECFAHWSEGDLGSYLLDISAEILRMTDRHTGRPVVEITRDVAGHKGTGRWAATEAMALGVPTPTLLEAVAARAVSSRHAARERLGGGSTRAATRRSSVDVKAIEQLPAALLAGRLAALAQGFDLLRAGGEQHGWDLPLAEIARIWQGGCIIRSKALVTVERSCAAGLDDDAGLLGEPAFARTLAEQLPALREAVALASALAVPSPCLSSALAWYDGMHTAHSSAALVQAQRDYFGAHGLERVDRPGRFHLDGSEA